MAVPGLNHADLGRVMVAVRCSWVAVVHAGDVLCKLLGGRQIMRLKKILVGLLSSIYAGSTVVCSNM